MGILGFTVVLGGIVLSLIPPAEAANKWVFEGKLAGGSAFAILFGLMLYYRGARAKAREAARALGREIRVSGSCDFAWFVLWLARSAVRFYFRLRWIRLRALQRILLPMGRA